MLFSETYLVDQKISDAISFVARPGSVACMHVVELVTHLLVILLVDLKQVLRLPVDRNVVPLVKIAGIHVWLLVILLHPVLMLGVNSR